MKSLTTKKIALLGIFIALSGVGAFFNLGGTTVAFDSTPAFVAAMLLGGSYGAIVGALGHGFTALLRGFPYGFFHIIIAIEMAAICFIGGLAVKKFKSPFWLSALIMFILNAFISPLPIIVWPGYGMALFLQLFLPLLLGSAANAILACILAYDLNPRMNKLLGGKI
jgi:uncharacterized membrane protein